MARAHGPSPSSTPGRPLARRAALALCLATLLLAAPLRAGEPDVLGPPLAQPGYEQLRNSWAIVQALLDKEDWGEALVQVDRLYEVQLDHGVRNLFGPGLTIVRASDRASAAGTYEQAVRLGKAAQRVAPDLPEARFHLARVHFDNDKLALGPVVSELTGGLVRVASFLPDRMQVEANGIGALLLALIVVVVIFALSQVARYFRLMAHDLAHLLPKGVSTLQGLVFTGLLLVVPFAFGVGLVFLAAIWILAAWIYMRPGERVAALLLLAAVAAMPWASDRALRAAAWYGSVEDASYRCLYGLCGPVDVERLQRAAEGDDGLLALLTLGTHARRVAALEPSRVEAARGPLERVAAQAEGDPIAHTSLGNLAVIQAVDICKRSGEVAADERFKEADAAYERAIAADAGYQGALYNRSVLLRRAGEAERADALYRKAQAAGEDALYTFEKEVSRSVPVDRCPTTFNANRHLIDPIPSVESIAAATFAAPLGAGRPLFAPFAGLVVGGVGQRALPPMAGGVAVVGLSLLLLGRAIRRSRFCGHCGRVACARCRSELADLDICDACLYFRIKGSFVDPKDLWFRERRIQGNETLRQRLMRLLTFLLPGAGHIYRGRTFRGLLYLVPFVVCVAGIVVAGAPVPDPVPLERAWPWLLPGALGVFAVFLYVVALVDIYSVKARR